MSYITEIFNCMSVKLGLKVTKVHRVLGFNQSAWLKKYINCNTQKRTAAKNAFQKDFFKLMSESVFWKNHGEYS